MIVKYQMPNDKAEAFEDSLKEMIEIDHLDEQCITWVQKKDKYTTFELEVFRDSEIETINLMVDLL